MEDTKLKICLEKCENAEDILRTSIDHLVNHVLGTVDISGQELVSAIMDVTVKCVAVGIASMEMKDEDNAYAIHKLATSFQKILTENVKRAQQENKNSSVWI